MTDERQNVECDPWFSNRSIHALLTPTLYRVPFVINKVLVGWVKRQSVVVRARVKDMLLLSLGSVSGHLYRLCKHST